MFYAEAARTPAQTTTANHHPQKGELSTPWTPAHHVKVNKAKPVRLVELGEGPHGKNARFEFPEGWQRTIDLPTEADAWHPLFSDLPNEDRRALTRHTASPVRVRADGKRIRSEGLSFVSTTIGPRGGCGEMNHFDVPAEDFCTGQLTGYKCAAELFAELERGFGPPVSVRSIIQDAAKAITRNSHGNPSQAGAGWAFTDIVVVALEFFAKHSQHSEFMARKIAEAEKRRAQNEEWEAGQRAQFVERMRKARAAKRAHCEREGA